MNGLAPASAEQRRSGDRARVGFIACFVVLGMLGLSAVYGLKLNAPPIRSDGVGYYLYLPSLVLEQDVTLEAVAKKVYRGRIPKWTGAIPIEGTDGYVIRYPIGEAILLLPFFLMACVVALISNAPLHGFSWPFQLFAAISGLAYATLGIHLLWRTMARWFSSRSILYAMIGVVYGTSLFHYATYDNIFSHTYSFFLYAAFLACAQTVFATGRARFLVLLGALAGLLVLTRPTNLLWVLTALAFGLGSAAAIRERLRFARERWPLVLGAGIAFALVIAIQLAYWKGATGHLVIYTYGQFGFDFASPEISNVLFSVRKGLFFWSPLWLAVIPGAWYMARRAPAIAIGLIAFLPLHVYVVASWWNWWYGGSFGQRPFVEASPVLALGLAALYDEATERGYRVPALALGSACVTWTVWLMLKYWTGVIRFDGTTWAYFSRTFFQLTR